ncbi:hypothetical protein [Microcoleus vaginatus]
MTKLWCGILTFSNYRGAGDRVSIFFLLRVDIFLCCVYLRYILPKQQAE